MGVNKFWGSTIFGGQQLLTPPPRHVRGKMFAGVDGGLSGGQACADPGARTPIGASGNFDEKVFIYNTLLFW